jgi:hypothetical protein
MKLTMRNFIISNLIQSGGIYNSEVYRTHRQNGKEELSKFEQDNIAMELKEKVCQSNKLDSVQDKHYWKILGSLEFEFI